MTTFLAKYDPLVHVVDGETQVWSSYQEWGGTGTARSFLVMEMREILISDNGKAEVRLGKLDPDLSQWPTMDLMSFLGVFVAGASNLNPELMEAALKHMYRPEERNWYMEHGLPGDVAGLAHLIDGVRQSRQVLTAFCWVDLKWQENFAGRIRAEVIADLMARKRHKVTAK